MLAKRRSVHLQIINSLCSPGTRMDEDIARGIETLGTGRKTDKERESYVDRQDRLAD